MKRVLTAAVLIPVVLLLVFRAPLWLFALAVAAIIVLALHEYLNIAEAAGIKPFKWLTYALAVVPIFALWISILQVWSFATPRRYTAYVDSLKLQSLSSILLLAPVIFGIALVFRRDLRGGLASAAVSLFGLVYVAASLSRLITLRSDPTQSILIIFVLFSVWAGDIAAYYVGRSFGKHKLAPVVSPNKSWEGAIASVAGSVAMAFVVFHFGRQLNSYFARGPLSDTGGWTFYTPFYFRPIYVIVLGIVTNVAAQFGDLFESALKRGAGVKDSGTLLPGHGGILDRIDALLFAIPVVWYYAQLTGFPTAAFE